MYTALLPTASLIILVRTQYITTAHSTMPGLYPNPAASTTLPRLDPTVDPKADHGLNQTGKGNNNTPPSSILNTLIPGKYGLTTPAPVLPAENPKTLDQRRFNSVSDIRRKPVPDKPLPAPPKEEDEQAALREPLPLLGYTNTNESTIALPQHLNYNEEEEVVAVQKEKPIKLGRKRRSGLAKQVPLSSRLSIISESESVPTSPTAVLVGSKRIAPLPVPILPPMTVAQEVGGSPSSDRTGRVGLAHLSMGERYDPAGSIPNNEKHAPQSLSRAIPPPPPPPPPLRIRPLLTIITRSIPTPSAIQDPHTDTNKYPASTRIDIQIQPSLKPTHPQGGVTHSRRDRRLPSAVSLRPREQAFQPPVSNPTHRQERGHYSRINLEGYFALSRSEAEWYLLICRSLLHEGVNGPVPAPPENQDGGRGQTPSVRGEAVGETRRTLRRKMVRKGN